MTHRADLIAIVESAYDMRATEREWLQGICDNVYPLVRPSEGMTAHHVDIRDDGLHFGEVVQCQAREDLVGPVKALGRMLDSAREGRASPEEQRQAETYEMLVRSALAEPADHLTHGEYRPAGPSWMYDLDRPVKDTFVLRNIHVDDNGVTLLVGGLGERQSFRPAKRDVFHMLSAHIKSGFRLRRRLAESPLPDDAPRGGAVLDGAGKVLHAEGAARSRGAIEALTVAGKHIDRARSKKSGRDEEALAIWRGLVRGEWSLVESIDADGTRFLLAHRNPEHIRDPRGLTDMEARVMSLAVQAYADALIAYHVGIAEGTASSHLSRAMQKLGVSSRVELVHRFGARHADDAPDEEASPGA